MLRTSFGIALMSVSFIILCQGMALAVGDGKKCALTKYDQKLSNCVKQDSNCPRGKKCTGQQGQIKCHCDVKY